jgi:Protein of unknown function (DUF2568)
MNIFLLILLGENKLNGMISDFFLASANKMDLLDEGSHRGIFMMILQNLNLAVRFLLEICALAAVGYWGFHTGNGMMKWVLGIGAPILIAMIWGVFGSPKAMIKVPMTLHIFIEIIVFGIPAIALFVAGKHQLAWIYGILVVLNRLLMVLWKQ